MHEEEKYFVLGQLEQPRQNKNLLYWYDKPNEPTREGPLSFVLFESPFTSVSTLSQPGPPLSSLSGNAYTGRMQRETWCMSTEKTLIEQGSTTDAIMNKDNSRNMQRQKAIAEKPATATPPAVHPTITIMPACQQGRTEPLETKALAETPATAKPPAV